jgi:hypothetical protein
MKRVVLLVILATGSAGVANACLEVGYDPLLMAAWADDIAAAQRGPLDIANPGLGFPTHGAPSDALGPASGASGDVFSLGDGGSLTAVVSAGIWDGPGDDLAIYENGFLSLDGLFAEFAYVEVSSDGSRFARFPSSTTNTLPVPSFGSVDPCDYDGLAGDKPIYEGTGFDLADLGGHSLVSSGQLDLQNVTHVRVVDVIGDGSTLDAGGLPIHDPYATAFDTGGFDIEAIGVLHAPEPTLTGALTAGCAVLALLARRRSHSGAVCSSRR